MLLWLYNLILLPVLFPYLAWRLLVRGKSREGLGQRFGNVPDLGPAPTLRRGRRLRPLLAPLFNGITRYLAQSAAIRDRAIALGLPPERAAVSGHTKFDQQVPSLTPEERAAVRADFGLAPGQPLFLAGSTHEGEEELILGAWERARHRVPDLALMLAPRHLSRVAATRAL